LIEVLVPPLAEPEPKAEAIPLSIVYEDDDVLVIDKPAGLVVHPGAGHQTGTLVNALIAHCGASLSGIGGVRRPGIVHRLDKDTSGLLVVAKNDAAYRALAAQFADHGRKGPLQRRYKALVWGAPDSPRGVVDRAIARSATDRRKMGVARNGGRRAVTHYAVERTFGPKRAPIAALLDCRLETGRTHQIRVHMVTIGHPLIGDAEYGAGFKTKVALLPEPARSVVSSLHRQALHAWLLSFAHPTSGREMRFESPLPDDIAAVIKALETTSSTGRDR
jgi:23S rRNA pseudouridine1911/1915/1917 synthase